MKELKNNSYKERESIIKKQEAMESGEKASSNGLGEPTVKPQSQVTMYGSQRYPDL